MKTIILALAVVAGATLLTGCGNTCCATTYSSCCGASGYGNWY